MALSKDLLEILACPKCVREPGCTGELEYREAEKQLVCHHCRLIYRIDDDIPIMLIEEAIPLDLRRRDAPGKNMEKVSVAVITLNEEANLRSCLQSVVWADEIVVVDGGSTDATVSIGREFQARISVEDWKGFSGQKNSAIRKTRNEWVLSLDADERVTPELRREIEETLSAQPSMDGYFIPRKNFFRDRWVKRCGWYPDYNLRLFRKSRGQFGVRAVHEKVEMKGAKGFLKNPLEHRTYTSLLDFLQRMNRYSSLAAQEMFQRGRRYRFFDLLFRPPSTFLQMYILRAGFLEGYLGFLLSVLYSFYTFTKYCKLKELQEVESH